MKSRYDFMKPSTVRDEATGDFYPDPLTLNYHSFVLQDPPTAVQLSTSQIEFFWRTTEEQLGAAELDDVVLSLNGIAHKNFLTEGTTVYFPSRRDLESSFRKK